MTDEMRELVDSALADRVPCILGTASHDGQPQISLKGSVLAYDDQTLAFWKRSRRTSFQNIQENPHVVIFYRNPMKRASWRFHGVASVHESGTIRDEVMSRTVERELEHDAERTGRRSWSVSNALQRCLEGLCNPPRRVPDVVR